MVEHMVKERLTLQSNSNDIKTVMEVLKEAERELTSRGYTVCRLWYADAQFPDGFTGYEFEGERPETTEEREKREQETKRNEVALKEYRRRSYEELKKEFEPQTTENKG